MTVNLAFADGHEIAEVAVADPAEIQWDKDNGAVYKAYMMSEMTE